MSEEAYSETIPSMAGRNVLLMGAPNASQCEILECFNACGVGCCTASAFEQFCHKVQEPLKKVFSSKF